MQRFDWRTYRKRSALDAPNRRTNKSFGRRLHHERLEERYLLSMTPWTPMTQPAGGGLSEQVDVRATNYDTYSLDVAQIRTDFLQGVMDEIAIPKPDGSMERFAVAEAAIMAPELAAEFPDIRTFRGQGIDDPTATIAFDVTPAGFHAQVLSPNGSFYIDPYYHLNDRVYAVYSADNTFNVPDFTECLDCDCASGDADKDVATADAPIEQAAAAGESTGDPSSGDDIGAGIALAQSGSVLRTYRIAVAATAEYTAFQGGTVALGQAAIVTAINRVSGIYESELSIRLQLIANNSQLVYTNAATDPYTNTDPDSLLSQNQTNLDSVIGSANYDVGHVFSTGGGGLAGLGVVGKAGQKAEGETGLAAPTGDAFYVDYVAHELGHQFGGNHSFNGDSGSCSGANRNASTAYEPGSGSTIMAYAGICGNDDLQPHSDPYFHSVSLDEIIAYVDNTIPSVGTRTPTGNSIPTVDAGINYTIPAQTPFTVTAVGSDANSGDVLTYDWEERDLGAQSDLAAADNGTMPLFRSFLPTTDPSRTFPQLSNLLSNTSSISEKLPTVARTMHLRATVRDNRVGGGAVNSDDMTVNVVNTGAAFAVTGPNTAVSWQAQSTQTVTWNVAGTTANGINTALVNILLSTDGGNTFSTVLASNTPNDGSQTIVVPNISSTTARIKVQAVGNIFFDISNVNFAISSAVPGVDLYGSAFTVSPVNLVSAGGFVTANISVANQGSVAAGAFDVKFYLSDDATINPANDLLLTLDPSGSFYDAAEPSAYHVSGGIAPFGSNSATVRLAVPVNDPFVTDNQYFLGMYVDADANIAETNETNNVNGGIGLDQQSVTYSLTFANPTTIAIPDSGASNPYPSSINVSGLSGKIGDVNVSLLGVTHTFPDDIDVLLVGPAGQKIILMSDVGGSNDISGVNLVLDDQAASSLSNSGQLASGTFKPTNIGTGDTFTSPAPASPYGSTLSVFNGTIPNGIWSLYVVDDQSTDTGSFSGGWNLTFTLVNTAPTNPTNVALPTVDEDVNTANNPGRLVSSIVTDSGSTDADGNALGIAVSSVDNTHGQWQYATNAVGSWQDILSATPSSARLLGPSYYLRFAPNADFNVAIAAAPGIGFKAWDQTFGVAGAAADTTSSNAFSAAAAVAKVTVAAINDAPIFATPGTPVTVDEDAGGVSVSGFATNIGPGPATAADEAGQSLAFLATVAGTTGTLSFDVAPSIDPTTGTLSFTIAADTNGTATIEVALQDGGSGVAPNVNTSAVQEFTIAVAAVNDEQVLVVDSELSVNRGSSAAMTSDFLLTNDIDDAAADLIYNVSSGPLHGSVLVNGAPATQFSQQQINAGLVSYQNDGTANTIDSFQFTVDDGKGVASGDTFHILIRQPSGDFDRNLVVDAGDYVLWRKTAGTIPAAPYAGADGNGDSLIDENDYSVWRSQFGGTGGTGVGVAGNGELGAGSQKEEEVSLVETAATVEQPAALLAGRVALPFSYDARASEWGSGAGARVGSLATAQPAVDGLARDEALVALLSSRGESSERNVGDGDESHDGQDCLSSDHAVDDAIAELGAELV